MVDNLHLSIVFHPQLANDDIVYDGLDLPPGVVVAGLGELQVGDAEGLHLQVLAPELGAAGELLPAGPAEVGLAVLRHHRRVVQHLLSKTPAAKVSMPVFCKTKPEAQVLSSVHFVGFAKQGVEGLDWAGGCAAIT